jgi:Serine acetyltransferase
MSIDTEDYLMPFLTSFDRVRNTAHFHGCHALPKMSEVKLIADALINLFFPGLDDRDKASTLEDCVKRNLKDMTLRLENAICLSYAYEGMSETEAEAATEKALKNLLEKLPHIRRMLKKDAEAGFCGDPAARNLHEIILCYPAIKALSVHRVAHELFTSGVPLVPRMLNETVHGETGIDIHPGASIGESFFIDHGTGVVIGETTVIGNNVKLYQGVTLGALSFPKDGCGMLIRGAKRHPTIGDNVTIYANATVLGDITIGEHSIIGSSAWIKTDIAPWSRVLIPDPEIIVTERRVKSEKP